MTSGKVNMGNRKTCDWCNFFSYTYPESFRTTTRIGDVTDITLGVCKNPSSSHYGHIIVSTHPYCSGLSLKIKSGRGHKIIVLWPFYLLGALL